MSHSPFRTHRTWTTQPAAALLVRTVLDDALGRVPEAAALAGRLRDDLGVRMLDLLDHVRVGDAALVASFRDAGWENDPAQPGVLRNPTGIFPAVLSGGSGLTVGFKVEYVHEFVAAQQITAPVEGAMHAPFRRVRVASANGVAFDAIEIPAALPATGADAKLKPNIPAEVAELNAMGKGRAFKIARFKGTLLTSPLEALLNLR